MMYSHGSHGDTGMQQMLEPTAPFVTEEERSDYYVKGKCQTQPNFGNLILSLFNCSGSRGSQIFDT